jgi:hypothetical protein
MKIPFRVVALLLLMPGLIQAQDAAPAHGLAPWRPAPNSVQLWNGHDLTGWVTFFKAGAETPLHFWSASDGVLHLAKTPAGYLRTEKSFANYCLHVEWRWPGPAKSGTNNSGIFVMQRAPDAVWPYSVQVQVKTGSTGDLIAQGGLTFTPGNTNLTLKKMAPANENPAGEWNSTDIYCRSASIEVFENGLRQNFVDKLPADSGQIALQMEGYPIDFRNLWLQPL